MGIRAPSVCSALVWSGAAVLETAGPGLLTDCAALLCLTGTTGRPPDQPSLVPVQVQKRNNVLKFTSLKTLSAVHEAYFLGS